MANEDYSTGRSDMAPNEVVNRTETPDKVKRGPGKSGRLKMTGPSFRGFSENITRGNLNKKIKEYNAEYKKLMELAEQLTGGPESARAQYDNATTTEAKEKAREDAIRIVNDFNAQVNKLAKLGVKILVFKDEALKAKMDKKGGRPIRVPGKLVTAILNLTKGGKDQLQAQEAQLQKQEALEKKMVEAIVQEAQQIMGTSNAAEGTAMENWGAQLDQLLDDVKNNETMLQTAAGAITDNKSASEPQKPGTPEENKGNEPPKAPGTVPKGKSPKAKKLEAVKDVVEKIKNEPTALKGLLAIPTDGKVALNVKANPLLLVCDKKSITEEDWGKVTGIENEEERKASYNQFIDLCVMRDAWLGIEAEEKAKTENVFNYVVSAVRDGQSQEDVRKNIPEAFSEEEKAVVTLFTEDFAKLTNGVKGLDVFVGEKTEVKAEEESEKKPEVQPVESSLEDMAVYNRLGNNVYKIEKARRIENIQKHLVALKEETTEYEAMSIVAGNERFMLYLKSVGVDGLKLGYKDSRKPFTVSHKEWGEIVGKENEADSKVAYENFGNLWLLAESWEKLVATNKMENPEEVFNYVVAAVRSGQEQENIRVNVPETFNDVQKSVVTQLTEDFEKLTKGVAGLDVYVGVKTAVKSEETPKLDPKKDDEEAVAEPPVVESKKVEETPAEENKTPVQNGGESKSSGGSYGLRYLELTRDLSHWLSAKKELENSPEENQAHIQEVSDIIRDIRNQLSEITKLHSLGKKVVKAPASQPNNEDVAASVGVPVSQSNNEDVAAGVGVPVSQSNNEDVAAGVEASVSQPNEVTPGVGTPVSQPNEVTPGVGTPVSQPNEVAPAVEASASQPNEVAPVEEAPEKKRDAAEEEAWWSRVLQILDDPKNEDLNIDQLNRQVEGVNRQMAIDRYAQKRKDEVARLQLRYCKPLKGVNIDEFIADNGHMFGEEERFSTPSEFVSFMQRRSPNMYNDMMASYNESMAEKQRQLMEKGHSFSEESQAQFKKR